MITVTRRPIEPKLSNIVMSDIKRILLNYLAGRGPNDGVNQSDLRDAEAKIYSRLLRDDQSHLLPHLDYAEKSGKTVLQLTFDEGIVEETE